MNTKRPTQQIYSNYTKQDFEVWETLFNRQLQLLKPIISVEYLIALRIINFTQDKIPDFEEVNAILKNEESPVTAEDGLISIKVVKGIIKAIEEKKEIKL